MVERDPFYADLLRLWLTHLPGVGMVSHLKDWEEALADGLSLAEVHGALMRDTAVPDSGKIPKRWHRGISFIAVLGKDRKLLPFPGCAVTPLPPGADTGDIICALGLRDCVRTRQHASEEKVLSCHEQRVVEMTVKGYPMKEIAEELACTVSSVQSYKSRAMEKLAIDSLADLSVYAAAKGWRSCPCRSFTQKSLFITS